MSTVRILIIGAGIGGLALAQGLRRRQIDFALFERDRQLDSRLQGYRIKIAGPMQGKLRDLLTDEAWEEFEATLAETHVGETTLNAPDAAIIACRKGRLPKRMSMPYTVDRGLLRSAMMKGIEQSVHFGKSFVRYEVRDDGVSVFFQDGSVEQGTLLVGADGTRSAVRKQLLPEIKPVDTETCCIYGKSFLDQELLTRFPQDHRWITVVLDQTPIIQSIISGEAPITLVYEPVRFINAGVRGDLPAEYIHWGLMFPQGTTGLQNVELNEALRSLPAELSLEITSEWHPSIRSLLELQDPSLTAGMRIYSASPNMEAWSPSANVTVMGDAIHVMSPSGGVGAVAAMNDASVLAQVISEEGVSATSIGRFEERMRAFSNICIQRSYLAGERMLAVPPFDQCKTVDL